MHIRKHDDSFVAATIYPHATPDENPLFLAASPHFTVLFDGAVTYNAKHVTLAEEARRCGEYLLALIEAERIAGKGDGGNSAVAFLAKSLTEVGEC